MSLGEVLGEKKREDLFRVMLGLIRRDPPKCVIVEEF